MANTQASKHDCECLPDGITDVDKRLVLDAFARGMDTKARISLNEAGLWDLHQVCHIALQLQDEGMLGGVVNEPGRGPSDVFVTPAGLAACGIPESLRVHANEPIGDRCNCAACAARKKANAEVEARGGRIVHETRLGNGLIMQLIEMPVAGPDDDDVFDEGDSGDDFTGDDEGSIEGPGDEGSAGIKSVDDDPTRMSVLEQDLHAG